MKVPPALYTALIWLDGLLREEVRRLRAAHATPIDEFHGLYIGGSRVDQLLDDIPAISNTSIESIDESLSGYSVVLSRLAEEPSWSRVCNVLELTEFEIFVLLLALAPEIDLKYETVYGYLNNDVARKWPTNDLALRLWTVVSAEGESPRASFGPNAALFKAGVLKRVAVPTEHAVWRAAAFLLDTVVSARLLGDDSRSVGNFVPVECTVTQPTIQWNELIVDEALRSRLIRCADLSRSTDNTKLATAKAGISLFVFEGRQGSDMKRATEAFAYSLNSALVSIDVRTVGVHQSNNLHNAIKSALLHQLMYGSVIHIDGLNTIANVETSADAATGSTAGTARSIISQLSHATAPVILTCDESLGKELVDGQRAVIMRFDPPDADHRASIWDTAAQDCNVLLSETLRDTVASRFILTPGQIRSAVRAASDECALSTESQSESESDQPQDSAEIELHTLDQSQLFEAARGQTRISLGSLARRVFTPFNYDDLVLPEVTAGQVREIASAIKSRTIVYDDWDFASRLPQGQGLKVLFSGASGTGKTMAAAVIAREVGLDLYAIDLSGIVSKYIGETEKNLDRVFRAAHCSNAILFFDECDALFGKRSEVKDAHDRYANIEVAYLLQKMESHDGAVILATNFSRNMDLAFSRRMQYVVEFPVPNETHRERLWRGMFPSRTPLADDIDFTFLSRHFAIAGGDIKNVALDAAFLAAQNGRVITMHHLVKAMARQMVKQGRSPSPTDFKHYFSLVSAQN